MTWSDYRNETPEDEYNDVDPAIGPQGTALICELRRLQNTPHHVSLGQRGREEVFAGGLVA